MLSVFLPPLEAKDQRFLPRALVRSSVVALLGFAFTASLIWFIVTLFQGGAAMRPLGATCLLLFVFFSETVQWEQGLWRMRRERKEVARILEQAADLAGKTGQPLSPTHVFLAASFHPEGSAQLSRLLIQPQDLDDVFRAPFYRSLEEPFTNEVLEVFKQAPAVRSLWHQAYLESLTIPAVLDSMGASRQHVQWLEEWHEADQRLRQEQETLISQVNAWPDRAAFAALLPATSVLARYGKNASLEARHQLVAPILHRDQEVERLFGFLEPGLSPVLIVGDTEEVRAFLDRLTHEFLRRSLSRVSTSLEVFYLSLADLACDEEMDPEEWLALLAEEIRALPNALFVFEHVSAMWSPDPDVRAHRKAMLDRCFRAAAWPILVSAFPEEKADLAAFLPTQRFHVVDLAPVSPRDLFLFGGLRSIEEEIGVFFSAQAAEVLAGQKTSLERVRERARNLANERGQGLVIDPSMVKDEE